MSRPSLRVLLAHSDRLELYGLSRALADDSVDVVGEVHTPEQLAPLVSRTKPDVVLIAAPLAESDGYAALEAVTSAPRMPLTLVLVDPDESERAHAAIAHGAGGFMTTAVDPRAIPLLLREIRAGNLSFVAPAAALPAHEMLTSRELTVLCGAARGLSNEAIGGELWLSAHTVKSHLHRIYAKLGVANRTEATRYALEHRLVDSGSVPAR